MPTADNRHLALRGLGAMRASNPNGGTENWSALADENVDNIGFVGQVQLTYLLNYLRHTAQVGGLDFAEALRASGEWFTEDMAEEL